MILLPFRLPRLKMSLRILHWTKLTWDTKTVNPSSSRHTFVYFQCFTQLGQWAENISFVLAPSQLLPLLAEVRWCVHYKTQCKTLVRRAVADNQEDSSNFLSKCQIQILATYPHRGQIFCQCPLWERAGGWQENTRKPLKDPAVIPVHRYCMAVLSTAPNRWILLQISCAGEEAASPGNLLQCSSSLVLRSRWKCQTCIIPSPETGFSFSPCSSLSGIVQVCLIACWTWKFLVQRSISC